MLYPLNFHSLPEPQVPTLPDTTDTLVCALGLATGLMGFLVGTVLIITSTCLHSAPRCRGPGVSGRKVMFLNRMRVENQKCCGGIWAGKGDTAEEWAGNGRAEVR